MEIKSVVVGSCIGAIIMLSFFMAIVMGLDNSTDNNCIALKFLGSDKLGTQYQNTIFMGDVNTGNLYNFKLNQDRAGLALSGPLADKIADTYEELGPVIFGHGFGVITDIKDNPYDGYLYILGYDGSIYKISSLL